MTLREESEWVETVQAGWNVLAGTDPNRIFAAVMKPASCHSDPQSLYGDGDAARRIVQALLDKMEKGTRLTSEHR